MSAERRYDPLTDRWVLLSHGRLNRPWQGQVDTPPPPRPNTYEQDCYLCPGNRRSSGAVNPNYEDCWWFVNDFPALTEERGRTQAQAHSLFRSLTATGECRVLCYHPDHSQSISSLSTGDRLKVVRLWRSQWSELRSKYTWVQIFENRGAAMGASSPHPHGQLWATDYLPAEPARENARQQQYFEIHRRTLLSDYLTEELRRGERVVLTNEAWVVVVPYWATWPFETLLLPRTSRSCFADLADQEEIALAAALADLTRRYDQLFGVPFPYSMGWHGDQHPHWTLHAHFYPPLLRSAQVRKHMVGFELLAEAQRDLTPEEAAQRLRQLGGL